MTYKISSTLNPTAEDRKVLDNELQAYAIHHEGLPPVQSFGIFMRDKNNQVGGGCIGCFLYGCLYIRHLWIHEKLRGQHYGTQVVQQAEELGKENGCTFATINTMNWPAPGFYKKLGYEIELERRGFINNAVFYFLRKELV